MIQPRQGYEALASEDGHALALGRAGVAPRGELEPLAARRASIGDPEYGADGAAGTSTSTSVGAFPAPPAELPGERRSPPAHPTASANPSSARSADPSASADFGSSPPDLSGLSGLADLPDLSGSIGGAGHAHCPGCSGKSCAGKRGSASTSASRVSARSVGARSATSEAAKSDSSATLPVLPALPALGSPTYDEADKRRTEADGEKDNGPERRERTERGPLRASAAAHARVYRRQALNARSASAVTSPADDDIDWKTSSRKRLGDHGKIARWLHNAVSRPFGLETIDD